MNKINVTFRGKPYHMSPMALTVTIIASVVVVLAMMSWLVWVLVLVSSMLSHYTGVPALLAGMVVFLLSVEVTANNVSFSILSQPVRIFMNTSLMACMMWFLYDVKDWEPTNLLIFAIPCILSTVFMLSKRVR